ncbi:hypothetical protein E8E11_005626 [Didymella keratinophila]|nr:hypothetical protein E8E11_005626 [Didymella keratinophila]
MAQTSWLWQIPFVHQVDGFYRPPSGHVSMASWAFGTCLSITIMLTLLARAGIARVCFSIFRKPQPTCPLNGSRSPRPVPSERVKKIENHSHNRLKNEHSSAVITTAAGPLPTSQVIKKFELLQGKVREQYCAAATQVFKEAAATGADPEAFDFELHSAPYIRAGRKKGI